jgi:hypothetical protein
MTTTDPANPAAPAKRKPPKGGRKGGTTFPRITLEKALAYSDRLVSKTHTGALPAATIRVGVFDTAGGEGNVRISALRQYCLLEGDPKGYKATPLAKSINAAPPQERPAYLQKAFLSPKLFQEIFTTFQGDAVTKAKIKQRALGLKVHPESAEECVGVFVESAETAGLATVNGDSIKLAKLGALPTAPVTDMGISEETAEFELNPVADGIEEETEEPVGQDDLDEEPAPHKPGRSKGGVTVNLAVDSSSDPDKLEKQLKLLKKFGLL